MFLFFLCFTTCTYAKINIDENNPVSRGECIMHIMQIIGVDPVSAGTYANADFVKPIFADLKDDDPYSGYIIIAKLKFIATGVSNIRDNDVNNFESNRNVTVKECLTFVLRCLKQPSEVNWDNNIIHLSMELGLLTESELNAISPDSELTQSLMKIILERMSNMDKRLHW